MPADHLPSVSVSFGPRCLLQGNKKLPNYNAPEAVPLDTPYKPFVDSVPGFEPQFDRTKTRAPRVHHGLVHAIDQNMLNGPNRSQKADRDRRSS